MGYQKGVVNEERLLRVRKTRIIYLPFYIMMLFLIGMILYIKTKNLYLNKYVLYGSIAFIVLGIKGTELNRFFVFHEITNNYLVQSKGIFSKNLMRIHIPTISDIVVKQSLLQRLLNFGTVDIHRYTPGAIIEVKNIKNPEIFAEVLEKQLNVKKGEE